MSKEKIGIQANQIRHPLGGKFPRFDTRTTEKVETTRAPNNGKPFRNRQQRSMASAQAAIAKTGRSKGAWVSFAPRQEREVLAKSTSKTGSLHIG